LGENHHDTAQGDPGMDAANVWAVCGDKCEK
jgi:hypothetical protein